MDTQSSSTQTVVQQVDFDIDSLFDGAPNADSVLTSAPTTPKKDEEKKPNIFSKNSVDLGFLDPGAENDQEDSTDKEEKEKVVTKDDLDALLDLPDNEDKTKTTGRPRTDKSGLVDTMSKLIDEGLIIPFDDEKSMEEYSLKDWKELLEANFQEREKAVRQETPRQFFESLPEELQYAAKYVADGGQDLKGLFKALAEVEEVREMSTDDSNDQEYIIRSYLRATGFGNDSEIDEDM